MPDLQARQDAPSPSWAVDTPSPFLQARVSKELRERAERAAADCDVPVGTWLRIVVEDALDAHEDVAVIESESSPGTFYEVRSRLGLCTCPGFVNHGHCKHLAAPEDEEIDTEAYLASVHEAAKELREAEAVDEIPKVEHPTVGTGVLNSAPSIEEAKPEPPAQLSPRDCPHLPQWVNAGRCGRCRTMLGRRSGMMRR
jgi:hypothetical protein